MDCPRCGLHVNDDVPACAGCGFTIADLDRAIGAPPVRAGGLTDLAGLVDDGARAALAAHIDAQGRGHDADLAVVTLPHARPITPRQYAFWLLNKWNVGGANNHGIVLLIAKDERRVECEVGYGLEACVTDDEAGLILDDAVVPHLKEARFADAIRAGIDALTARIAAGPRAAVGDAS